jgi:molecular chaperone GrpE
MGPRSEHNTEVDPGGGTGEPGRSGTDGRPGTDGQPGTETGASGTRAAAEAAELEDRWRRALADSDNLRKRYAREIPRERAAERERVAAAFLPVLDNIDLALRHAGADPSAIIEGVRAVRDQAIAVLARLGYELQDEAGVPFDPARHEVVAVVPPDEGASPGLVVDVVRPGYGGPEHQLRPAAVTVSRAPGS